MDARAIKTRVFPRNHCWLSGPLVAQAGGLVLPPPGAWINSLAIKPARGEAGPGNAQRPRAGAQRRPRFIPRTHSDITHGGGSTCRLRC